jgi:hypothetical protein
MDLRFLAMGIFLIVWSTLGGLLSGIVMGLFFMVYQDGCRKGVLPSATDGPLFNSRAAA